MWQEGGLQLARALRVIEYWINMVAPHMPDHFNARCVQTDFETVGHLAVPSTRADLKDVTQSVTAKIYRVDGIVIKPFLL